jgi:hypothetical protein
MREPALHVGFSGAIEIHQPAGNPPERGFSMLSCGTSLGHHA